MSIHFPPVSCRPKAVSCPRVAGLSCPASDGTRRVAGGRGGGGRRSLTAAAPPDANRRSRSIAQPVFVVARSAPYTLYTFYTAKLSLRLCVPPPPGGPRVSTRLRRRVRSSPSSGRGTARGRGGASSPSRGRGPSCPSRSAGAGRSPLRAAPPAPPSSPPSSHA